MPVSGARIVGEAAPVSSASGMRHIAMLTGDNNRVAGAIGGSLDLDAFYSELLPEDKVAAVKSIARDYGNVVMVGDGVNDAPALAAATVGVAMGGPARTQPSKRPTSPSWPTTSASWPTSSNSAARR